MSLSTTPSAIAAIPKILDVIQGGEVAIIPTATTYALVCDAYNPDAVARIHQLKRWRSPNPLAVFSTSDRVRSLAQVSDDAAKLLAQFPAPLTLVLPKTNQAPDAVTAGYGSLLVCCPDEFVRRLVEASSTVIACGSASWSSDLKATNYDAAVQLFGDSVPLIVDGGRSHYGRGGTMIDCTLERPTILKYGPLSFDDLRPIVPNVELPSHMRK